MKKIVFVFMLMPFISMAQFKPPVPRKEKVITDSVKYYEKQLVALQKQAMDSLAHSEPFLATLAQYKYHRNKTNNYTGFTLFTDFVHSDYGSFNERIVQKGFAPLKDLGLRLGVGVSTKQRWVMFDFYFAVAGFNTKTKNGNETIKASLTNVLQFDLGVNLLSSKVISLYPYGGLSMRVSNLSYKKPEVLNPNYTDVTDFVVNNQSVTSSSTKLGYQAGIGIDVVTNDHGDRGALTVFFLKAGMNRPFGTENYKIFDADYKPDIKQGLWSVAVGVKFASRH